MKRLLPPVVYALFVCVVCLFWARGAASRFDGGANWWLEAGRLCALLASVGLLAQVVALSRAGWLSAYRLENLLIFHRYNGPAALLLALCHPLLLAIGYKTQGGGSLLAAYRSLLEWPDVPLAAAGLAILVAAGLFSARLILRHLPYEWWKTLKNCAYIGIALTFFHQPACGADLAGGLFLWCWYGLYAFAAANILWYRVVALLLRYRRHGFRISSVTRESASVVSITIGGRDMDKFTFEAGQFAILRFMTGGLWMEAHPFSFSKSYDGAVLRFTIKNAGDFTGRLQSVAVGTPVLVDGPHGGFTASLLRGDKCLLVAGGIGITPLLSIAQTLCARGVDCVLVYINRTFAETALKADIDAIAGLKTIYVMTRDPGWTGEHGHPDAVSISRLVPDVAQREVFLCGPEGLMQTLPGELRKAGVQSLHTERFAF